jgi:RHS repeat-associated protein
MNRGVQSYYYHQNALWSPLALTDSGGNVVERYTYNVYGSVSILDSTYNPLPRNPWGTEHSAVGNSWIFTGRQLDEETGLYDYRARFYDSIKGRFLQRDPLHFAPGLNLYEYVSSSPADTTDPYGLDKLTKAERAKADALLKKFLDNRGVMLAEDLDELIGYAVKDPDFRNELRKKFIEQYEQFLGDPKTRRDAERFAKRLFDGIAKGLKDDKAKDADKFKWDEVKKEADAIPGRAKPKGAGGEQPGAAKPAPKPNIKPGQAKGPGNICPSDWKSETKKDGKKHVVTVCITGAKGMDGKPLTGEHLVNVSLLITDDRNVKPGSTSRKATFDKDGNACVEVWRNDFAATVTGVTIAP